MIKIMKKLTSIVSNFKIIWNPQVVHLMAGHTMPGHTMPSSCRPIQEARNACRD